SELRVPPDTLLPKSDTGAGAASA
ncbi:hypothetical protein VCEM1536_001916B, partial [Vibrio cholerae O1 str. EM-1536]